MGDPQFDNLNSSFLVGEFDWQRIRRSAGAVKVYHADNDPYVPLAMGRELAEQLGVEATVIEGGGHLNLEAGYSRFDLLRDEVLALAGCGTQTNR